MKTFKKTTVVNGYNGDPIKTPDGKDLDVLSMFYILVNTAPCEKMNDSIQGMGLAQALDKAKSGDTDIEIEEAVYEWIKNMAEKIGPSIFRINAQPVHQLIKDGYEKGGR